MHIWWFIPAWSAWLICLGRWVARERLCVTENEHFPPSRLLGDKSPFTQQSSHGDNTDRDEEASRIQCTFLPLLYKDFLFSSLFLVFLNSTSLLYTDFHLLPYETMTWLSAVLLYMVCHKCCFWEAWEWCHRIVLKWDFGCITSWPMSLLKTADHKVFVC
jgi:hypothetical protein